MNLMRSLFRLPNSFRLAGISLLLLLAGALAGVLTLSAQSTPTSTLALSTALGSAFTYQGRLNDGANPAKGDYDFQFTLFDAETGGTAVGTPVALKLTVIDGVFTAKLDFGAGAFTGAPRWLAISVRPTGTGNFSDLTPRQPITPAPYAIYADNAGTATNVLGGGVTKITAGTGLSGTNSGGNVTLAVNFAGSGTADTVARSNHGHAGQNWSAPRAGLTVASQGVTSDTYGVKGSTTAPAATGLVGKNSASAIDDLHSYYALGVSGISDAPGGRGIEGDASAGNGKGYGVAGFSTSPEGAGIYGNNKAVSASPTAYAVGVWGETDAVAGNAVEGDAKAATGKSYGVAGSSKSPDGRGVYGVNNAASGRAIQGEAVADGGRGVLGNATANTGFSYGVEGYSQSPNGLGVFGYNSVAGGRGVQGDAVATAGPSYGVFGTSQSPQGAGIYGYNISGGWAGYFAGNVYVNGNLGKKTGNFKIDHPLDPANKYLYHSFVESPDMMDIYNGNVLLDASGEALVQMPAWFEALNMEFRYQLTPIGAPGPNLYIAQEIANNQFKIAGGAANTKVSWQVTGIRHDPYAQAHRIPVEEDKPIGERGTYLSPLEYGQPVARGLNFQPTTAQTVDPTGKALSTQASGPTAAPQTQPTENK